MTRTVVAVILLALCGAEVVAQGGTSVEQTAILQEKSCVGTLRALNTAQVTFWGGDEKKGFARTLKQLGPEGEALLNAATVSGNKDGYRFRLIADEHSRFAITRSSRSLLGG